jgi:DNA-binding response OmpR family regulator
MSQGWILTAAAITRHAGGEIHVDLAARSADVAGTIVHLSRLEFELLVKFASDPVRLFSRDDLARCI